jgi:hypothetical protein
MSTTKPTNSIGPVELLVVKFPGNKFKGEIAPALADLVESGTIRIIDILFAYKDEDGGLAVLEINDLAADDYATFNPIVSDITGLLTVDDARHLSAKLENNSSVALMLFENTWAIKFRDAVVNADGELVFNERIPRAVIEELVAEHEQLSAQPV